MSPRGRARGARRPVPPRKRVLARRSRSMRSVTGPRPSSMRPSVRLRPPIVRTSRSSRPRSPTPTSSATWNSSVARTQSPACSFRTGLEVQQRRGGHAEVLLTPADEGGGARRLAALRASPTDARSPGRSRSDQAPVRAGCGRTSSHGESRTAGEVVALRPGDARVEAADAPCAARARASAASRPSPHVTGARNVSRPRWWWRPPVGRIPSSTAHVLAVVELDEVGVAGRLDRMRGDGRGASAAARAARARTGRTAGVLLATTTEWP